MQERPSVLIVDDDATHLQIYGWIVEGAGYRALTSEVRLGDVALPEESADLVLLDYRLGRQTKAVQVAQLIKSRLPGVPIIVLSEEFYMPDDIAPLVQGFVRKGDPARLVDQLNQLLRPPPPTPAQV